MPNRTCVRRTKWRVYTCPYVVLNNYQNALMHKSELRDDSTLINRANKVHKLKRGLLRLIGILSSLESTSEVDSTFHYKKSIKLQYFI